MPIVRNKKQTAMYIKYKALQKAYKKKGISMGLFDYVAQKAVVELPVDKLEKMIKEQMVDC